MKKVFIIFGATGDLMQRKITPSLYGLNNYNAESFDNIIAFGRRDYTTEEYRKFVVETIKSKLPDESNLNSFLNKVIYHKGNFDSLEAYQKLMSELGEDVVKYIYLAVPQSLYGIIIKNLKLSNLTSKNAKLILEKPIGFNSKSAKDIESLIAEDFKEKDIYRLDHYLGKEMVNNILYFRKENPIFQDSWNKDGIKSIEIALNEDLGVEQRGEFYDSVGAFRDMGQNHILNILSLLLMEIPQNLTGKTIVESREKVLSSLEHLNRDQLEQNTFRAQYEGYQDVLGVSKNSTTETFFRVKFFSNDKNWKGVPIFAESGKRLGTTDKYICIKFVGGNKLLFRISPTKSIFLSTKNILQQNLDYELSEIDFESQYPAISLAEYIGEYTKLFNEVLNDNKEYFLSKKESELAWAFTDPIVEGWKSNLTPLRSYKPGDKSIINQGQLIIN